MPGSLRRHFQRPAEPKGNQRTDSSRHQVNSDREQSEFGRKSECHERCETGTDQPGNIRGERRAGVAVFTAETGGERTARLAEGETQQRKADQDEEITTDIARTQENGCYEAEETDESCGDGQKLAFLIVRIGDITLVPFQIAIVAKR